jgi:hypothetical protein
MTEAKGDVLREIFESIIRRLSASVDVIIHFLKLGRFSLWELAHAEERVKLAAKERIVPRRTRNRRVCILEPPGLSPQPKVFLKHRSVAFTPSIYIDRCPAALTVAVQTQAKQ